DLAVLGKKEPRDDKDEVITYADARRGIYKKVILREGRLAGAILLGDASIAPRLLRAFHKKETIPENPAEMLFPALLARPAHVANPSDAFDAREEAKEEFQEDPLKEVIAIIRPERWLQTKPKVESL